jgi:hypothetical protein
MPGTALGSLASNTGRFYSSKAPDMMLADQEPAIPRAGTEKTAREPHYIVFMVAV